MTTPIETPLADLSPDEEAIKKLLVELHSNDANRRWEGAKALAQLKASNEQIINALRPVAAKDFDIVRQAAREALAANEAVVALGNVLPAFDVSSLPGSVSSEPQHPFYLQVDFWLGFGGWYVVNGLWWAGYSTTSFSGYDSVFYVVAPLPLNFIVLVIAAFKRRRLAGGMLVAIALNLVIALLLGATMNATCGIPFFIQL